MKTSSIAQRLRSMIVRGDLAPKQRLETRAEMAARLGVSGVTIQAAMDQLAREGFVEAHGRSGTLVADNPPHLTRYALALPTLALPQLEHSRFYEVLASLAASDLVDPPERIKVYRGVSEVRSRREDLEELLEDLRCRRLAGLVFGGPSWALAETGVAGALEGSGVPAVTLGIHDGRFPYPSVYPDAGSFFKKAYDHLSTRGRKRIAWFVIPARTRHEGGPADEHLKRLPETPEPHLVELVCPDRPWSARSCVRLLAELPARRRPDAVVITDDNLVRDVTEALAAAGMRAPDDIDVVAHCNHPDRPPAAMPVTFLGFDIRGALSTALEVIRKARRGEPFPRMSYTAAAWEEDLAAGARAGPAGTAGERKGSRRRAGRLQARGRREPGRGGRCS